MVTELLGIGHAPARARVREDAVSGQEGGSGNGLATDGRTSRPVSEQARTPRPYDVRIDASGLLMRGAIERKKQKDALVRLPARASGEWWEMTKDEYAMGSHRERWARELMSDATAPVS